MTEIGEKIKSAILKNQEALNRFRTKQEGFLVKKQQITRDIEEARETWNKTLEQLPEMTFGR
ncbi:MAG: hypothetical protein WCK34_12725 [Bacteroidota bacterium]